MEAISTSGTLATTLAGNTNANRFVGQVNNFDTTSNNWQITGVQLECGDSATPFEYESYEESLAKCKRYYTSKGATVLGYWNGGTNMEIPFQFFPSMRATPTVAVLNATGVISNKSNSSTGTQSGMALVNSSGTANGFYFVQVDNCDTGTSPSAGHIGTIQNGQFYVLCSGASKIVIDNVIYGKQDGQNICILAEISGVKMSIPLDEANSDYQTMLEWVADGNTIDASE